MFLHLASHLSGYMLLRPQLSILLKTAIPDDKPRAFHHMRLPVNLFCMYGWAYCRASVTHGYLHLHFRIARLLKWRLLLVCDRGI